MGTLGKDEVGSSNLPISAKGFRINENSEPFGYIQMYKAKPGFSRLLNMHIQVLSIMYTTEQNRYTK